jgi:rhomboid protease GluP
MNREFHLRFCNVCQNKGFDLNKGIICKLTGDIADFENDCSNFEGDREKIILPEPCESIEPEEQLTGKEKFSDILFLFIPHKGYFFTPLIIWVCITIFTIMAGTGVNIMEPESDHLIKWGANFKPLTLDGQLWRILTNIFLHIGLIHLLVNMYALIFVGIILEPLIGQRNFIVSFIVAGITASIASLWWNELVISAGASGAIFGLYGVYIALMTTNILERERRTQVLTSMLLFVGFNLVNGLRGDIDNAAHIGGLVSGLFLGYSLFPSVVRPEMVGRNKLINFSAIVVLFVFSAFVAIKAPNPVGELDRIMNQFVEHEEKALQFFRLPPSTANDQYLMAIKVDGLPNWEKCMALIKEAENIEKLPEVFNLQTDLLKKYTDFRIKSYELMALALESNTRVYDHAINSYNQKIELIIQKIQGKEIDDYLLTEPDLSMIELLQRDDILFVVNGTPIKNSADLDHQRIISMVFLKKEDAEKLYGTFAKNGALMISTH